MSSYNQEFKLARPNDLHLHVRDGLILTTVLRHSARQFSRAIIMPNLQPPITTTKQAMIYRQRILEALPDKSNFTPMMTLYLTDNTSVDEIRRARDSGIVHAVKLYPTGITTNSDAGVTDLVKCDAVLEEMEACGLPLLVHGEVNDPLIDIFDREKVFITRILVPLRARRPGLKIVFEHITTRHAVQYVIEATGAPIAATITAHHLLYNRNILFKEGKLRPHYYCLPILKREEHRKALVHAAISGNPRFFLGTDSAPHLKNLKECASVCAGCYTALHAMELYTQIFDEADALHRLEGFASFHGSDFYGQPRSAETIILRRESWIVPIELKVDSFSIVPFYAGKKLVWKLLD